MEKRTGVAVPLGALYTKESPACGDFLSLIKFADFCNLCNLKVIQLLPVNDTGTHSSPYSGLSAFALHPLYIRIDALPEFAEAYKTDKAFSAAWKKFQKDFTYSPRFDYTNLLNAKTDLLHLLYIFIEKKIAKEEKSESSAKKTVINSDSKDSFASCFYREIDSFVEKNRWVISYAVFKNLKDSNMQSSWKSWEENLSNMSQEQILLRWNNKALKTSHNFFVWCQIRTKQQFLESAEYIRSKGIILKGDIPIMMNEDSCDAWTYPEFFNQELRAGSPPDGENPDGQNWGFPTYNWDNMKQTDYSWWRDRVKTASEYYDAFRIDHILGFFRIWATGQNETNAFLGHTIPYSAFTKKDLLNINFDENRIKWLSLPHIPTGLIEDITWNHDEATKILEQVCDRVNGEELWNFKKEITGDRDIYAQSFSEDADKDMRIKNALALKWKDRTLIEIEKNKYIQVYSYQGTTAWKTLNDREKESLVQLFDKKSEKENRLWKENALKTLTPIINETKMIPCAEDLGVNLKCLPEVLKKLGILSLKVVRWSRYWEKEGQPYVNFEDYGKESVATTSVHDSSTLRQWWNTEKDSVRQFVKLSREQAESAKKEPSLFDTENENVSINADSKFTSREAMFVMQNTASCSSAWFINPLQDYLYLEDKYYLEDEQMERINIPGSVNDFNWTYRIPCCIEDFMSDTSLLNKINSISEKHDGVKK